MRNRTKAIWLAVAVVVVGLAVLAFSYLRPLRSGPQVAAEASGGSAAARPVPGTAAPAPATEARPPASGSAASASSVPAAGPFGEKEFIELSATILIRVAQVQDRPDAEALIPAIMEKSLSEAGVEEKAFEAVGKQIHADPKRRERVADAILKRVEERATPEMRLKVADLAEAMARSRQGQPAGE